MVRLSKLEDAWYWGELATIGIGSVIRCVKKKMLGRICWQGIMVKKDMVGDGRRLVA